MKFIDLFAGLGGFHRALNALGHECVFASEINPELQELYRENFPEAKEVIHGDIREVRPLVPEHDILCAGFPCQPFSKSGEQLGFLDVTRGTLFHEVLKIADEHRPEFILLENVGNFARHDSGETWRVVRKSLEDLGYNVRGTEPKVSSGSGLLSPHHFGHPHHRERFFAVATTRQLARNPFPKPDPNQIPCIQDCVTPPKDLSPAERTETKLSSALINNIEFWNEFLELIPDNFKLPSFPMWGDELDTRYPFEKETPHRMSSSRLASSLNEPKSTPKEQLLELLPSYARTDEDEFPAWKKDFIRSNRVWWDEVKPFLTEKWRQNLYLFPASQRKLEWNCKGEVRDLWSHILQVRPSGIRVKRYTSIPALVAMTSTQIPILGPHKRYLARSEALRLQGFPDHHRLPKSRDSAFKALGNAVHVDIAKRVLESVMDPANSKDEQIEFLEAIS